MARLVVSYRQVAPARECGDYRVSVSFYLVVVISLSANPRPFTSA